MFPISHVISLPCIYKSASLTTANTYSPPHLTSHHTHTIRKCVALAHNVYAVAGADENICLSAVAEVRLTIPRFAATAADLVPVAAEKRALRSTAPTPQDKNA